jgi:hypothetical protein
MNERKILGYICLAPLVATIVLIIEQFPMHALITFLLIILTALGIHFITTMPEERDASFKNNSK